MLTSIGRRLRRSALRAYFIPALLFCITTIYVFTFYYRGPVHDSWLLVRQYMQLENGTLRIEDLFITHGFHWHASAYAVLLPLAQLTGFNAVVEVMVSLLISLAGFFALATIFDRAVIDFQVLKARTWLLAMGALFWFSLDQADNWLWGWQVAVFINLTGVIACIALLTSKDLSWFRLSAAAMSAALAVFAFATGWAY